MAETFAVEQHVKLQGLQARPELNGQVAVVLGPLHDGRYPVKMIGTLKPIRIKPINLYTDASTPVIQHVIHSNSAGLDETKCGCCGEDECSLIPSPKALHLDFNGRSQFAGVAQLNGVIRLLDDWTGPLDGPGQILTPEACEAHVLDVEMRNIDRVPDDGPYCIDNLHFDMTVPANAAKFRLHPGDGEGDCVGRGVNGVLAVEARPGDRVKVALDVAAALEAFGAPADQIEAARQQRGEERYWARVLTPPSSKQMYVVLPIPHVQQQGQSAPMAKCPFGRAPARLLCLLRARLVAPGS